MTTRDAAGLPRVPRRRAAPRDPGWSIHPDDLGLLDAIAGGGDGQYPTPVRLRSRDGRIVWVEGRAGVSGPGDKDVLAVLKGGARDAEAKLAVLQHLVDDAVEQRTLAQELARQALHDPLTTLPNRAHFLYRLRAATQRAAEPGHPIAVLFLDLDDFKLVNDGFGHHVGDQLLATVADRLQACLRGEDTVARFGGDEFTILLEHVEGAGDAVRVAQRIADRLRLPVRLGGHELRTTVSIGIALSGAEPVEAGDLLRDADVAMYRAKTSGKARHVVFDPSMSAKAVERLALEIDLRRAAERHELQLYYQPIVRLDTGQIGELEALIRWRHPRRGLLRPCEFVPLAEQTGLIVPIGQWVLEQACRQARVWAARAPDAPPLAVSVNVSARQLQHPGLVDQIAYTLAENGLEPHRLKLEITESAAIEDAELANATLWLLKTLGVQLALDDFGVGHSSLSYLKRFPVDTLKIDRSFVDGLGKHPEDTAIVHAVIAFAQALGLKATAEGIETAAQVAELRRLGCDLGQGNYFAQPMPGDEVGPLLEAAMASSGPAGTHQHPQQWAG